MQWISAKSLRALVLVIAVALGSGVLVFAQGTSGSLTGQVSDPSGAAVVGATVTLTNLGTNYQQVENSNSAGVYLIRPVDPGNYSLDIVATGFAQYKQTGIVINANEAATQDVHLKIGAKGETVNVTADAELVNTSSAQLGMTVNENSISSLPLNGRDPSTLVLLAPGMINAQTHGGEGIQSGFSFSTETAASSGGGRQGSTFYMLDGVPHMDNYNDMTAPFPNSDATKEFTVITNNFSAQYGFSPGAVVSIVTKDGTNEYHGGVFWYVRNNDLNAKDWFSGQVDPLKRNQFGAYAGGPVIKNKLFIFGNYQGTHQIAASTNNNTVVPTPAMLTGDFSALATTAGVTNLVGPFHTVNGKANQLDTSLAHLDTAAVNLAKDGLSTLINASNLPANGVTRYTSAANKNIFNEGTGRLDYDISSKQRLSFHTFTDLMTQPSGDVPGDMLSVLNMNGPGGSWVYSFWEQMDYFNDALTHTWTINPTMVNNLSIFWNENSAHNAAAVDNSSGSPICLHNYINVNEESGCYMEGFTVTGAFSGGWTEPSQEVRNTYGFRENLLKTAGKHSIAVGADLVHQFAEEFTQYPTNPIVTFGADYTTNALADYLMGYLNEYMQGAGEIADVSGWQFAPFAQDDWRIRSNLTINLGLRWDPNFAPTSAGGRGAAFVAGQQSSVFPNAPKGLIFPGDTGMTTTLMNDSYGYWEPRLGLAWQPKMLPNTAIHAGFGMFTGPLQYSSYNHAADIAPFSPLYNFYGNGSSTCYTGGTTTVAPCSAGADQTVSGYIPFDNPWSAFSGTGGKSPFPPFTSVSYKPASTSTFATPLTLGQSFTRNFKMGVTQSWNLSVEHQFTGATMARLAYVGSESFHQSVALDQNAATKDVRPYANFLQLLTDASSGTASFNALEASVEHKMSHGLQVQSSLTWSKAIDTAVSSNISFGSPELGDPFNLRWNRGVSYMSMPLNSVTNFVYRTPSLRPEGKLMEEALGDWELSGILNLQSGNPFTVMSAGYSWNKDDSGSLQYGDRADRVAGQPLNVGAGNRQTWANGAGYFNDAAFNNNAIGTFGSSAKNPMFGPRQIDMDASIMKNWSLKEGASLQFRWDAFNATNHPNFGTPAGFWGCYTGWKSVVGSQWNANNNITTDGNYEARIMQGSLRITF